ncbi:hypothetical protein [Glycomyces sp. NPDC021274]|uniref:hypothetical protein n=1 Tax=Glycomyces sp. NPDC021274 TaxID=3155120 RepID=UPI0033C91070
MSSEEFDRILDRATVHHLQPDDVLVFSNVGDSVEPEDFDRIKSVMGDRWIVVFHGPVELEVLRNIDLEEFK